MQNPSNIIVSIIISTCGKADYLKKCLDSCLAQSLQDFELIVIDNSCDNALSAQIQRQYPAVKLFSAARQLSYCESLNRGIAIARGDFILCLNDDATLTKEYLKRSLEVFAQEEKIAMVSGKILRPDTKTIDTTGLFLSYFLTARERGYGKPDRRQYEKPGYIFGVSGAAAFYRKTMLEQIKQGEDYFDSDFNFFYEDLDIAWRAQNRGWKAYYTPAAIAYHVRGGSFRLESKGINKPFARRYLSEERHRDLIKNRYLTILKNEKLLGFLLHLPGFIIFECLQWGYCLIGRRRLIKSFWSDLKYFPAAFQKRKLSLPR